MLKLQVNNQDKVYLQNIFPETLFMKKTREKTINGEVEWGWDVLFKNCDASDIIHLPELPNQPTAHSGY